jgi:predicted DNA-binding transcriptional regulator AlpA
MKHGIPSVLRFEDLQALFKISRSSLARWEAKNLFPHRVRIGENSIGWRSDEVNQWLQERSNKTQEV